jgi:hypothetical protein
VHVRLAHRAQHAIHGPEQLREVERQRRLWRRGLIREKRAGEVPPPVLGAMLEHVDDLAHLLVFEQTADELRARVLPIVALTPRQEHLRLDAQQPRRHLEIVRRLVEPERPDAHQELFRNSRDRDVVNVHLLVANERKQEVEWSGERPQLDDESALVRGRSRPEHRRRKLAGAGRNVRVWSGGRNPRHEIQLK